jgi:hypothetical protein
VVPKGEEYGSGMSQPAINGRASNVMIHAVINDPVFNVFLDKRLVRLLEINAFKDFNDRQLSL